MNEVKGKRIIGLDMHPDVFAAAALSADQSRQKIKKPLPQADKRYGYCFPPRLNSIHVITCLSTCPVRNKRGMYFKTYNYLNHKLS